MTQPLPSTKPYFLRAVWEWCCDNGFTPYIAVAVDEWTKVPREFVRDGEIVLNLGADATNKLRMGNDYIDFQARFGGVARDLSIPVGRVAAIYAKENGAGMGFELDETNPSPAPQAAMADDPPPSPSPSPAAPSPSARPKLQRIK